MKRRIFVSYSSPDQAKADKIRQALEAQGISCWIAPRDLSAGTQWGAGIVQAIDDCEAVLVVFSAAANSSPQVAREMELAVSKRRPLIPVRVADDQPTNDMQYFLGVSHWFNAYAQPVESYLPEIIQAVRNVLARESNPWANVTRRMPKTRAGQLLWGGAGVLLIALVMGQVMRPSLPGPVELPLAGRWEADLPDGKGGTVECVFDVQKDTQARFSDSCPAPLMDSQGSLGFVNNGAFAPGLFKSGDTGSFTFYGGSATGFIAAFKMGFFGGLTTRDSKFGDVKWSKISSRKPLKSGMDDIVPASASWPLEDVPGIAKRARNYAREKWKSDAELIEIDVKMLKSNEAGITNVKTAEGGLYLTFRFYSPETQEGLQFTPGARGTALFPLGVIDRSSERTLPDDFVDLPDAVALLKSNGMRAKQIYEAQLQDWGRGSSAGGAQLNGIEWMIDSQLQERFVVRATK